MKGPSTAPPDTTTTLPDLTRCLSCGTRLRGEPNCPGCRRVYPVRDGIREMIGPLWGRNRIVAEFYNGPGWRRFRPWEQGFLVLQGGVRKARMEILRHVLALDRPDALGLEVGIGDGANLPFLPPG